MDQLNWVLSQNRVWRRSNSVWKFGLHIILAPDPKKRDWWYSKGNLTSVVFRTSYRKIFLPPPQIHSMYSSSLAPTSFSDLTPAQGHPHVPSPSLFLEDIDQHWPICKPQISLNFLVATLFKVWLKTETGEIYFNSMLCLTQCTQNAIISTRNQHETLFMRHCPFFLWIKSWKSGVCVLHIAHLSVDQTHVMCSVATCGPGLPFE